MTLTTLPYYDASYEDDVTNPTHLGIHPFIQRCMFTCDAKTARKSPTVLLDPGMNNKTLLSSEGSKFKPGTDCYWDLFQNPTIDAGNQYYKYQIELNFTQMNGVLVTVHNGTSLFTAGDAKQVDTLHGEQTLLYNASLVDDYSIALEVENLNHVWVKFTADGSYDEQSSFIANVGLRAFERDDDDDDEEETTTDEDSEDKEAKYPVRKVIIVRHLTFNEKVVFWVFLFGILLMCFKNKYCYSNLWCCHTCLRRWCCPWCCERVARRKDAVEREFHHKNRTRKLDFDVNMQDVEEEDNVFKMPDLD